MTPQKYLAKNIIILIIGQFGTKLLGFFLVPLYTNILSTQEYGIFDLMNSSISVLVPVLTVNINGAVFRFLFDEEKNKKEIFSIGCKLCLASNFWILVFVIINHFTKSILIIDQYYIYFILIFFVHSFLEFMISFTRGIDKVVDLSVSGIICSSVVIISNIFFLCILKKGLDGYFLANIIGPLFQIGYLFFRTRAWKSCNIGFINKNLQREMIQYSTPLIANSVAWWMNSLSDRYLVTYICGLAENGIYSIASKIPSVLNIFQTIFSQAWGLSAIKEFNTDNKGSFYSQIYKLYDAGMVLSCTAIIVLNRFLAKVLYAKDFYMAWKYTPFLMIGIVFGAMSGYIGGIFQAVKDSKIIARSTIIGGIINIVLNIIFIPIIGALGAAIATTISYGIVLALRISHVKLYIDLDIKINRDICAYSLMVVQGFLFLLYKEESLRLYLWQLLIIGIQVFLYKYEIIVIYKTIFLKSQNIC